MIPRRIVLALLVSAQAGAALAQPPPGRGGGSRPPKLAGHETALLAHLRRKPDATLAELRSWLFETRGVSISVGALWNALERLGWTLKKSHVTRRSRNVPTLPPLASPGVLPSPG